MNARMGWTARVWPPYLLAGILWITVGTVVLGDPRGLGLLFVGLSCLAVGGHGAALWLARRSACRRAGCR